MAFRIALKYILNHYGYRHQVIKLFEEMAELQVALCKGGDKQDILTEIADVEVMLGQIKIALDIDTTDEKRRKVRRQIKRINNEG